MTGDFIKLWQRASQSSLPTLIFVALILLLAYQLACSTWYWLSPPWQNRGYVAVEKNEHTYSDLAVLDINAISRYQLFGKRLQHVAEATEPVVAPETKLKLELRGVIATGDSFGAAIIADDRRREGYYRIGDELPGGVGLHEVFADRVILDRDGVYETLTLPSKRMSFTDTKERGRSTRASTAISEEATQLLHNYRELLLNDPQQLIGAVRTFPVRRNGQLVGYRIAPGRDRSLLNKFGLRPGDIVTTVNGISLNSPANGLAVMQKLNSAQSLSLEVERNGRNQSFQFSLE
ncbi:MAG: type II secretion system protein GspC [Gammaproteobacteria bacterium]|nr:type II secretion system protein GspC [Gammaproteobacteria bacterium]MCF6229633.1 type II secretion system protein GspC [Gammaproteobacteria bacterium]